MKERAISKAFKMPRPVSIAGRISTITNSFVNGIIPVVEPSDEEVEGALRVLGISPDDVRCAYCGDPATEWDHLNPIVSGKRPTGFISEIHNLVPACGKCNQSKGGSEWREWITGPAPLSPASRGVPDLEERISRIASAYFVLLGVAFRGMSVRRSTMCRCALARVVGASGPGGRARTCRLAV